MKKKICVVTGTRAEYGILKPLLDEISRDRKLLLQLVVTGTHLSPEFGLTYREIEADGYKIDEKAEIILSSDSCVGIAKAMALALSGCAESYERLRPDVVVGLGDRFELLSAAAAALVCRIPFAHIGGGEITEGVYDDAFRHAITKMSCLHFASTETYRRRILQMGEAPGAVFNVGEIGLEGIRKADFLPKADLEKKLAFRFKEKNLLVTFHPLTLERGVSKAHFESLLRALDANPEVGIIFTHANADSEGRGINQRIEAYVAGRRETAVVLPSLGRNQYLSAMRCVDAVVGNSSSGIVEAPSLGKPTVNIGDRQKGRIMAASVLECAPEFSSIRRGLAKALSVRFSDFCRHVKNPYECRGASRRIAGLLKKCLRRGIDLRKSFHDLGGWR
jgi:GDP/UDP-N,N'-diacetylbacillosamine 2-epimerase (hydrolysing)